MTASPTYSGPETLLLVDLRYFLKLGWLAVVMHPWTLEPPQSDLKKPEMAWLAVMMPPLGPKTSSW
jgi:hypothetical protein